MVILELTYPKRWADTHHSGRMLTWYGDYGAQHPIRRYPGKTVYSFVEMGRSAVALRELLDFHDRTKIPFVEIIKALGIPQQAFYTSKAKGVG